MSTKLTHELPAGVLTLTSLGETTILYPGTSPYADRTASYWSVSAQQSPSLILQPHTAKDVSAILVELAETRTPFAVRSGGCMCWAGSNNIDGGVTVDLGLMYGVIYNTETKIASIQPGARWKDVYGTLEAFGVAVTGGRSASVSVGGFLIGGGNSFFTARRGFGCDGVVGVEVVLADGRIVNASATENEDLFRALKGGSFNFGIVTRFDMEAFPVGELWGGAVIYHKAALPQLIRAHQSWAENLDGYPDGSAIVAAMYKPNVKDIVVVGMYHDTVGKEAPPAFDRLLEVPHIMKSTLRKASLKEMTIELDQPKGYREIWKTLTFRNDLRIYEKIAQLYEQMVDEWKAEADEDDFSSSCVFQAITKGMSKHSVAKGGNVLGLDSETDNAVLLLFTIVVHGKEREDLARGMLQRYFDLIAEYAKSVNGLMKWVFLNYADGTQDPIGSYGAANLSKIREAAAKYDPNQVFQKRAPGGFKVSRANGGQP